MIGSKLPDPGSRLPRLSALLLDKANWEKKIKKQILWGHESISRTGWHTTRTGETMQKSLALPGEQNVKRRWHLVPKRFDRPMLRKRYTLLDVGRSSNKHDWRAFAYNLYVQAWVYALREPEIPGGGPSRRRARSAEWWVPTIDCQCIFDTIDLQFLCLCICSGAQGKLCAANLAVGS